MVWGSCPSCPSLLKPLTLSQAPRALEDSRSTANNTANIERFRQGGAKRTEGICFVLWFYMRCLVGLVGCFDRPGRGLIFIEFYLLLNKQEEKTPHETKNKREQPNIQCHDSYNKFSIAVGMVLCFFASYYSLECSGNVINSISFRPFKKTTGKKRAARRKM